MKEIRGRYAQIRPYLALGLRQMDYGRLISIVWFDTHAREWGAYYWSKVQKARSCTINAALLISTSSFPPVTAETWDAASYTRDDTFNYQRQTLSTVYKPVPLTIMEFRSVRSACKMCTFLFGAASATAWRSLAPGLFLTIAKTRASGFAESCFMKPSWRKKN